MKKILLLLFMLIFAGIRVFASDIDTVKVNFNKYVQAANSYSPNLFQYYDANAKIIRQVVKPDGTTANATTDMNTYTKQMKISQGVAKMRNYKNTYTNITAVKLPNGNVKISSLRQPMQDNDKLKTYQIWHKNSNGTWVIIEEMMQTRQQIFLKYADK